MSDLLQQVQSIRQQTSNGTSQDEVKTQPIQEVPSPDHNDELTTGKDEISKSQTVSAPKASMVNNLENHFGVHVIRRKARDVSTDKL